MQNPILGTHPLVSIVVVTYNSEKYVIETLESIQSQTYSRLELIITDDCSKDNTVGLCINWIKKNEHRFENTKIITSQTNTGISSNMNRGCSQASGEWIKPIAADDILLQDAISNYTQCVKQNPQILALFAQAQCFISDNGEKRLLKVIPSTEETFIYSLSPLQQFKILLHDNLIKAPTSFIKRQVYDDFKFDERYKYLEDYPYWLNITLHGVKLSYLDKITVLYRVSNQSISHSSNTLFPSRHYESMMMFFFEEKQYYLKQYFPELIDKEKKQYLLWLVAELLFHNRRTLLSRIMLRLIRMIFNSFRFIS